MRGDIQSRLSSQQSDRDHSAVRMLPGEAEPTLGDREVRKSIFPALSLKRVEVLPQQSHFKKSGTLHSIEVQLLSVQS